MKLSGCVGRAAKMRAAALCLMLQLVGTSSVVGSAQTLVRRLYTHADGREQGHVRAKVIHLHHRRLFDLSQLEFEVEQGQLEKIAEELQVPLELVSSWDVQTWLTPAQVCLTEHALREELVALFSAYARASATPIAKLDILHLDVDLAAEECKAEEELQAETQVRATAGDRSKRMRRGGEQLTGASAACVVVIAFAMGQQAPTFNPDAFAAMHGVGSIGARVVRAGGVALNTSFLPSPASLLPQAFHEGEGDGCCEEGWLQSHLATIAGGIGGCVALCGLLGLLLSYRFKHSPAREEGRDDGGRAAGGEGGEGRGGEAGGVLGLNPVGGLVRCGGPTGALVALAGSTLSHAPRASWRAPRPQPPLSAAERLREQQREELGEGEGGEGGGSERALDGAPGVDVVLLSHTLLSLHPDLPHARALHHQRITEQLRQTAQRLQAAPVAEFRPGLSMQDVIKVVRAQTLKEVEEQVKLELERAENGEPPIQAPPSPNF